MDNKVIAPAIDRQFSFAKDYFQRSCRERALEEDSAGGSNIAGSSANCCLQDEPEIFTSPIDICIVKVLPFALQSITTSRCKGVPK